MPRASSWSLCLALVSAALAVAGCGDDTTTTGASGTPAASGAAAASDPRVAAQVPAAAKRKGTLRVAADATYAPNEFIGPDGHTVIGMDVDLAHALGDVMGVELEVVNASNDSIIPGIAAGKFDLAMSSFTDTKEREKVVDFVTYFKAGTSFYLKAGDDTAVTTLADLCGTTVAVEKGTLQQDDATAQSAKCRKAGKPPVTVRVFPDQNGANLAISSGRAQVGMADSPVVAYIVEQSNGQFEVVGRDYGTAPYGIMLPNGSELAKPILAALEVLIENGRYEQVLEHWGLEAGAIEDPVINGAVY